MAACCFSLQASDEEIIQSKVQKVTVYTQGAQVFRKGFYSVSKGISKIIIEDVSKFLNEKSIQVQLSGDLVILDTKFNIFHPKPNEFKLEGLPLKIQNDIEQLTDSIEDMNYQLKTIQNEIDVLNATKAILTNNGAVRGQGKVNDSIDLLKATVEYYVVKMNELNVKIGKLNLKKTVNVELRNEMSNRLTMLKNYQQNNGLEPKNTNPIPRIVITVQANAATKGNVNVSYLVSNAGWTPSYDIRSDISNGKILLHYKALVYQNTGEEWNQVLLTVSTNNPYQNKTKPTLHPWYINYLSYYQNYDSRVPTPTNNARKEASKPSYGGAENIESKAEEIAMSADQFTSVIDRTISAEFAINLPYTIPSNNEKHIVLIKKEELVADYKYYTVPKLDQHAYLVAQISKLEELQLVPATATIFFEGSYMGETYINPNSMQDTLTLSLGSDPNIIVKRTYLKNEVDKKIVGSTVELTNSYQIEVKSLKSQNIELIIQDQIPITQIGDIEIKLLEASKAKYNDVTGMLEWRIKLRPNQLEKIKYSYEIKHNKDKRLNF